MSFVRKIAIKRSEIKKLTRQQLMTLAARCCIRVDPTVWWPEMPEDPRRIWKLGVAFIAASGDSEHQASWLTGAASNAGTNAFWALEKTDEIYARVVSSAFSALAKAIEAVAEDDPIDLIIEAGKHASSVAASLAHGGKVKHSGDVVDFACHLIMDAIRADALALAAGESMADVQTPTPLCP